MLTSKFRLTKITVVILIVAIVASILAAVAISYHTATNTNNPTPTPTPTTMPSPQTTTPPTNPTATPTKSPPQSTPTQSPTQEKVRDHIMLYIKTNHPETAQFIRDLIWSGGEVPLNLVGSSTYSYYSNGWNLTMTYPVVQNPIYKVIADYSAPHTGIPYRVIWEGTWQLETIKENNYTFAQ
jgi:hypothetical protein